MPRIADRYLDCVIYIYSSRTAADAAVNAGGSGFLVQIPLEENKEFGTIYAITNDHVINKAGDHPAIRLNTKDGKTDVIPTNSSDWKRHRLLADIRAIRLDLAEAQYQFRCLGPDDFLAKEAMLEGWKIGPGDETFMVGRFVTVGGKQKNTPAVRFGNVAMLPYEPIKDEYDIDQESFLVECRSISGYSGSPVFFWIAQDVPRPPYEWGGVARVTFRSPRGPWLLGVNWCHISNYEKVHEIKDGQREEKKDLCAQSNTAMAGVIPSWLLWELLNSEEFVAQRKQDDREITRQKEESQVVADSSEEPLTKGNQLGNPTLPGRT